MNRYVDPDSARAYFEEMRKDALPVRSVGRLTITAPDGTTSVEPFVSIDASTRPDIPAAIRELHIRRVDRAPLWPTDRFIFLPAERKGYWAATFTMAEPIPCHFKFLIVWPDDSDLIETVLQRGVCWITPADITKPFTWDDVLGFKPGAGLRDTVEQWKVWAASPPA